jgi:1-phosphofructokinase family hexose kinase
VITLFAPNPGLDRTVFVDRHQVGREHRAGRTDLRAGGKAINVARALGTLGVPARVIAPVAGPTGDAMLELAAAERIAIAPVPCDGLTRSTLAVVDPDGVSSYNDSGFVLTDAEVAAIELAVREHTAPGDLFVFAGSVPRGTRPAAVHRILTAGRAAGARVLADTSGKALSVVLAAEPDVVSPNLEEARALLADQTGALPMESSEPLESAIPVARALCRAGPAAVVLSAGAAGAVVADEEETAAAIAPRVEVLNPVGAGDCLLAALLAALENGAALADALPWAVAVASASCETFAAADFDPARARELAAAAAA